ncbi:MAG: TolC family protein [Chlamydiales bacterium]|nr:TolC family protein [Chlamydiales bacterium]
MKFVTKILALPILALSLSGCGNQKVDYCKLRQKNNDYDMQQLYCGINIPDRPLTIDDIVQIALCRNLSLQVKEQEYEIQRESVTHQKLAMLPMLNANYESSGRTKNTGSFSESLTNRPPAPPSISSTQHTGRWDVNIVYNLLDFGIAYYRTRQECSKALIAQLEYQRLKQNLVVDVTKQFWKALVSRRALAVSKDIIAKTEEQQMNLQRQMDAKVISEIQGLRNKNRLINIHLQLQSYEREYDSAMSELKLLMGIPSQIEIEVAEIESTDIDVEIDDVNELECWALFHRPELYSKDIEERIMVDEVHVSILQMFPGIELFAGPYHDQNRFLIYNDWFAAGVRATADLLSIPQHMTAGSVARKRQVLARKNRLALAIGVLAQVRLAYLVYEDNLESYILAKELEQVNKDLLHAAKTEQRQGKLHEADILKYEAEAAFSEINALRALGELENALEQLNNSMGLPQHFRNSIEFDTEYSGDQDCYYEQCNECHISDYSETTWINNVR